MRASIVALVAAAALVGCASRRQVVDFEAGQAPPAVTTSGASATTTTTTTTVASAPASEVGMDEETAKIEQWRQQRVARLTAPDGWLTLVGLEWLGEGRNRLGSDAQADVKFPAMAPATIGWITRHGGDLALEVAPGVPLTIGGEPVTGTRKLMSDAEGEPTEMALGSFQFYVIQRGDRWAVRIKDSESPVRAGFQGIDYFPITLAWRVVGRFEPAAKGATMKVPNILGAVDDAAFPGTFVFTHDGHEVRLKAIDEGDGRLFIVFGDTTNGHGTYGGGRFVYAPPPVAGQPVVLDFNQAYNPPCVFTPYATCPLPPPGNKVQFAIEAGEKLWAGYHHPG